MRDLGAFFGPISVIFRRAFFFFCKNTPKSVFNDIYNIQVFQDTYSQNGFFPHAFQSPDPAARPTRPPVMDHRLSNWFVFQYFQVHRLSNWFVLQYFQVHRSSTWVVFQYFQVLRLSKWVVFQYFQVLRSSKWFVFQYFQNPRLSI